MPGLKRVSSGQGTHTGDPLAGRQRLPGVGEAGAVGQGQLGVQLQQRSEHEAPGRHLAVGQAQSLVLQLEVAEQQQVDVERARPVAGAAGGAPALGLDLLAEIEQLERLERGPDPDRRVEEVGLVEDLADRFGDVGG